MKELYLWRPYFTELARKIAENGESYLIDRAKQVKWKADDSVPPLLQFGDHNIDPFSFFYTVAGNSPHAGPRKRIYESLSSVFELQSTIPIQLDDAFIFPTPPLINTLFHSSGKGNSDLMWQLFRSAVSGFDEIDAQNFSDALKINNIKLTKLTQALFLINSSDFLPIDQHSTSLGLFPFKKAPAQVTLREYADLINCTMNAFPGCDLIEINLYAYLLSTENIFRPEISQPRNFFQISTNAY